MKSARRQGLSGKKGGQEKGWNEVASWYDKLVGVDGSDYHRNVILPSVMKALHLKGGEKVLDLCCGQGVLVPHLIKEGVGEVLGVDASEQLIAVAKKRYDGEKSVRFIVGDACETGSWADSTFDRAACVMAVHDVADAGGLFRNLEAALKSGGEAVIAMMHPCFRIPRESHWGWDADQKFQFRRLDRYGKALEITIETRPGQKTDERTTFYHRPLAEILSEVGKAGLCTVACEELYSHRRSQSGPFSKAEHRAAEEFPLFLQLTLQKVKGAAV